MPLFKKKKIKEEEVKEKEKVTTENVQNEENQKNNQNNLKGINFQAKKPITEILIKPLITEKAVNASQENKYIFIVNKKANKISVKEAISRKYNVKVEKVNIVNIKGKTKYFKGIPSKTKSFKKAIVTLKKGEKIEIQ
jgi:large subunit ribosomal protein L23